MTRGDDWALVIPLANEEGEFDPFIEALQATLNRLGSGTVYLVVDTVSKDRTLELSHELATRDERFKAVWAPENRNVVDAYLRGYREAYENGHAIIIEMDAGLSHDPRAIPMFLRVLNEGNECAFGSRFINGGSITESNLRRTVLSKVGTILSNVLLGTRMYDTTSGYQGFHRVIVGRFLAYPLLSKAHFYQTELRYLLRRSRFAEIPIHYKAPSPRVSQKAIGDSIRVLLHYFKRRLLFKAPHL
ncbi:MAG TPA: glycosyltransferase [Flavobacteriales bacterium]|nr:glycosyltransferase [Flavobacteriales bacterium]HNU56862.1 glycosyltransferase [Flavobacteriales bacterium]